MILRQLFDEEIRTYTYLIADEENREAIIIDSVNTHIETYMVLLEEHGISLKYSLETDVHADHITAGGLLRQQAGTETGVRQLCEVECAEVQIQNRDVFRFGKNEQVKMIVTPGHTPGSVSFLWRDRVFTGDSLFIDGYGRTDFQGGDPGALYDSITQRLFTLPYDTLLYSGHDYSGHWVSNIAQELAGYVMLADQSRELFAELMNGLDLPASRLIERSVPANRAWGLSDDERHDTIPRRKDSGSKHAKMLLRMYSNRRNTRPEPFLMRSTYPAACSNSR